jgi:hypothetical protein
MLAKTLFKANTLSRSFARAVKGATSKVKEASREKDKVDPRAINSHLDKIMDDNRVFHEEVSSGFSRLKKVFEDTKDSRQEDVSTAKIGNLFNKISTENVFDKQDLSHTVNIFLNLIKKKDTRVADEFAKKVIGSYNWSLEAIPFRLSTLLPLVGFSRNAINKEIVKKLDFSITNKIAQEGSSLEGPKALEFAYAVQQAHYLLKSVGQRGLNDSMDVLGALFKTRQSGNVEWRKSPLKELVSYLYLGRLYRGSQSSSDAVLKVIESRLEENPEDFKELSKTEVVSVISHHNSFCRVSGEKAESRRTSRGHSRPICPSPSST